MSDVRTGRRWPLALLLRAARRRAGADADSQDEGFILLESMIAITIVTIVMAALATFFASVINGTGANRTAQLGDQLATSALDKARAVGGKLAVANRDQTSVTAQFSTALAKSTQVAPWLATMTPAVDSTAGTGSGATAALPTSPVTQTVNGLSFGINYFVGLCYRSDTAGTTEDCVATNSGTKVQYVRVVVAVSWPGKNCPTYGCSAVSATLLSAAVDPVFNFNQAPPPQPTLNTIASQYNDVGDTVNGMTGVSGCSSSCTVSASSGVPPYIFSASGLPPGLAMNSSGLVSGTPTTAGTYAVTVLVTDAFLDTNTAMFTWTVYSAIRVSPNPVPNQASLVNATATTLTVTATGGSGAANLTWTASGLPTGISISSSGGVGSMSGKPTAAGTYNVTVTVTDSKSGSTVAESFVWTVGKIVITQPGPQSSTVGSLTSLTLTASGGTAPFTWSVISGSLPTGLLLVPGVGETATISGIPLVTGSYSFTVQITDAGGATATATISWTIYSAPSITSPGNQVLTVGQSSNVPLSYSCPSNSCTFSVSGGPSWLQISGTGVLTGTATTSGTFSGIKATITQPGGSATTAAFTFVVYALPTIASPGNQSSQPGQTATATAAYSCSNAPCTVSLSGNYPSWLGINGAGQTSVQVGAGSGTVTVQANGPNSATAANSISLTIADSGNQSATSTSFSWTIAYPPPTVTMANQTTTIGTTLVVKPTYSCSNTPCTYSATSLPSWVTFNTATGAFTGKPVNGSSTDTSIIVKITDATDGQSATANFAWYVAAVPTVTMANQATTVGQTETASVGGNCSNGPCTYSTTALPGWLNFSGGTFTATPTASSTTASNIKVTITDASGATASVTFSWTVNAAPVITSPGNQTSPLGAAVSVAVQSSCGTASCSYSLNGAPSWLTISASTGTITGTAPTSAKTYSGLTVTITDSNGATATTAAFSWAVTATVILRNGQYSTQCGWYDSTGPDIEANTGCSATANYQFTFASNGTIASVGANKCLEAVRSGANATLTLATCPTGTPSSAFVWSVNADGSITNSQKSGGTTYTWALALPSPGSKGTLFTLPTYNSGTNNQTWTFQ